MLEEVASQLHLLLPAGVRGSLEVGDGLPYGLTLLPDEAGLHQVVELTQGLRGDGDCREHGLDERDEALLVVLGDLEAPALQEPRDALGAVRELVLLGYEL